MRITRAAVVIVVIVLVCCAGLLFPGVQAAREANRRMQCGNNMKEHCLALQNYHDTFLYLPYGARNRTVPPDYDQASWGPSWIVSCIPFYGINRGFDSVVKTDAADPSNDYVSAAMRANCVQFNGRMRFLFCPSSPLPQFQVLSGQTLVVPSYAGIMGAAPFESNISPLLEGKPRDPDPADNQDGRIAAAPYGGLAASNGMLCVNESLTFAACVDGTANCIIVGEVSGWYFNDEGQRRNPTLSVGDAGDGVKNAAGWIAGTNLGFAKQRGDSNPESQSPEAQRIVASGPPVAADAICNLITIRHAVGIDNRQGANDFAPNWGEQGIGRCGVNNPLNSAHPAGAMVGYLDGHVALLTKSIGIDVVQRLAVRDDGGWLGGEW